jgi:hypothetical protein
MKEIYARVTVGELVDSNIAMILADGITYEEHRRACDARHDPTAECGMRTDVRHVDSRCVACGQTRASRYLPAGTSSLYFHLESWESGGHFHW